MLRTWSRVTLPLAGVNFLNQASRAVVATIGPLLAVEFGLSAGGLGFLAASLFAAYALTQLPVGLALDLYGARQVQTVLALMAATGFVTCALATSPAVLGIGRFVTGIGIAAGLMAMMQANAQWFPRDRLAGATGAGVFVGAAGGLCATVPVQVLLPYIGWRGAFLVLAGLGVLVSACVALAVPRAPPNAAPKQHRSLGQEAAEFGRIAAHPVFRRFVPAVALLSALNFTYQGLWAGPWLRDVGGLDDAARAGVLLGYAVGYMLGSLALGQLASRVQRRGGDPMRVVWAGMGAVAVLQAVLATAPRGVPLLTVLWFGFAFATACGPTSYSLLAARFPAELAGRVATAMNTAMLVLVFALQNGIGLLLDLWPRAAGGGWDPRGYAWALAATLTLQALATVWLILGPRDGRARPG